MLVPTSRMPRVRARVRAGWSLATQSVVIASIAACRTVTRSSSASIGSASSSAADQGSGISTMLVRRCSTTAASPARKPIAYGSENAYDSRSVSSTPTASALPLRSARAAASGPA